MTQKTRATAHENGRSAFSVDIEVGGYTLQGDEPSSLGGGDSGPAPFDLLTAALAECTAMTVRWYAQKKSIPMERVSVEVVYHPQPAGGAVVGAAHFEKSIALNGSALTDEHKQKLLEIAAKCPIQKVLEMPCAVTTRPSDHV